MAVAAATDADFSERVLKSDRPVVVDFWAEWCRPCKMIAPILEEISEEFAGQIDIVKVDIEKSPQLAVTYNVSSLPTLMIFRGGEEIAVQRGATSKSKMTSWIQAMAA